MKIARLKYKLRHALQAYYAARDGLDCGAALAGYINPQVQIQRDRANKILDELKKLDPKCPPGPI